MAEVREWPKDQFGNDRERTRTEVQADCDRAARLWQEELEQASFCLTCDIGNPKENPPNPGALIDAGVWLFQTFGEGEFPVCTGHALEMNRNPERGILVAEDYTDFAKRYRPEEPAKYLYANDYPRLIQMVPADWQQERWANEPLSDADLHSIGLPCADGCPDHPLGVG